MFVCNDFFFLDGEGELSKNGDDLGKDDEDDDDDQPVLKKARQESPKLSSILLGDAKKSSYSKSSDSSSSRTHYTIPNCTKVTHIKKKTKKAMNPVSILPKGLNSCVSIMNIPNPNTTSSASSALDLAVNSDLHSTGAISLGGGITISPQKSSPVDNASSSCSQMKPLPYLRKMLPGKGSKKGGSRPLLSRILPYYDTNSSPSSLSADRLGEGDPDRGLLEEKLLLQRLEFGSQEHALKMKVLEKQLQAYTNEAQFWALKTKLLKSGRDDALEKLVNGDV